MSDLHAGPVSDSTTRVFICDDVADLRMLFRVMLEDEPDLSVVGEAGDGRAGVEGVRNTRPDVLLLDISMPVMDGLETIPAIHALGMGTRIIVLSGHANEALARRAVSTCASRYLDKSQAMSDVIAAVREVASAPPKVCTECG